MKLNEKTFMGVGLALGTAAAVVSAVAGLKSASSFVPEAEYNSITLRDGVFKDENGNDFTFSLIAPVDMTPPEYLRKKLRDRFGTYGQAQLVRAYEDAFLTAADMRSLADFGFNSIVFSLTHITFYSNGIIKGEPDFSRLDSMLESCRQSGMYAVLSLISAEQYVEKEKPEKAFSELWLEMAAHCADFKEVAAFLIPAETDEKSLNTLLKGFKKKKINKPIIVPSALAGNAALKKYQTAVLYSFLDDEIKGDYPAFVSVDTRSYAGAVGAGAVPFFTGFKSTCNGNALYRKPVFYVDLQNDSYETITEKYKTGLLTSDGFELDEEFKAELTSAGCDRSAPQPVKDEKHGFSFNVGFRSGKKNFNYSK